VAILLPVVMALARLVRRRRLDRWCFVYPIAGAVGLLAVMVVMWKQTGGQFFPPEFMKHQDDWGRQWSWPWATINQGFDNLFPRPETIMIPALVARNFDLWCLLLVGLPIFYSMGASAWDRRDDRRWWVIGWSLTLVPLYLGVILALYRFKVVGAAATFRVPGTKHVMTLPYLYLGIAVAFVVLIWLVQPLIPRFKVRGDGWPMETWLIGIGLIAVPISSTALASFNRFSMADWIIYPVIASFLARLPRQVRWIPYVVLAVAGAVVSWRMVGRISADRFVG
jgi:hypothetical protein